LNAAPVKTITGRRYPIVTSIAPPYGGCTGGDSTVHHREREYSGLVLVYRNLALERPLSERGEHWATDNTHKYPKTTTQRVDSCRTPMTYQDPLCALVPATSPDRRSSLKTCRRNYARRATNDDNTPVRHTGTAHYGTRYAIK